MLMSDIRNVCTFFSLRLFIHILQIIRREQYNLIVLPNNVTQDKNERQNSMPYIIDIRCFNKARYYIRVENKLCVICI